MFPFLVDVYYHPILFYYPNEYKLTMADSLFIIIALFIRRRQHFLHEPPGGFLNEYNVYIFHMFFKEVVDVFVEFLCIISNALESSFDRLLDVNIVIQQYI